MVLFTDRRDAGRQLAGFLATWRAADAVVVGVPRGGVVVGAEVAAELGLPLTAVAVRKLGAPGREEYAVGAVAAGVRVIDETALRALGVDDGQLADIESRERVELARRADLFGRGPGVRGRTALVVDDGVATGATAVAACRAVRAMGAATVVLAVPVAPADWHPEPGTVDAYVCPHRERGFWAVGAFYADFAQTPDAEVLRLLAAGAADTRDGDRLSPD